MDKEEIRRELEELVEEPVLTDLTTILHKYYHPEHEDYTKYTKAKIQVQDNDYLQFVKHLIKWYDDQGKDVRVATIRQNISYLSNYEVELKEEYVDRLFNWTGEEMSKVRRVGKLEKEMAEESYSNFRYKSYLALKHYLKAKGREDLVELLPESKEVRPSNPSPRKHFLTEEQVQQLLDKTEKGSDTELIILLGFYSGLRIQEILQLKGKWINYRSNQEEEYGEIKLPSWVTKSGEEETVFFNQTVLETLHSRLKEIEKSDHNEDEALLINLLGDEILEGRKGEIVIEKERSEAIKLLQEPLEELAEEESLKESKMEYSFTKLNSKEGDNLTPHVLRRSFLRDVEKKKGLKTAQEQARHNRTETTEKYLESTEQQKKEDYKEIF